MPNFDVLPNSTMPNLTDTCERRRPVGVPCRNPLGLSSHRRGIGGRRREGVEHAALLKPLGVEVDFAARVALPQRPPRLKIHVVLAVLVVTLQRHLLHTRRWLCHTLPARPPVPFSRTEITQREGG
eukprot:327828-Pyramimonas_sp.AAC.1